MNTLIPGAIRTGRVATLQLTAGQIAQLQVTRTSGLDIRWKTPQQGIDYRSTPLYYEERG